jgi:hypothetical protein
MNSNQASRIVAAVLAIVATAAVHGGWLSDMDRDAVAATAVISA